MKRRLLAVVALFHVCLNSPGFAAPSAAGNAANQNVTITADGSNGYVGNVATANDNVVCLFHDCTLTADHLIYNSATHTIIAIGNAKLTEHEPKDTVSGAKIVIPDCTSVPLHLVVTVGNTPDKATF